MFDGLSAVPDDPLLRLIAEFREDLRPEKIDLGVGVYRNADGATPVMAAVKAAEAELLTSQGSKAYLGLAGDQEYLDALRNLTFATSRFDHNRLTSIQTPGGSGALRLASDLFYGLASAPIVFVGAPSWANHLPIFEAAGLETDSYSYIDPESGEVNRDVMFETLSSAPAKSIFLFQGCCHNPTGLDLTDEDWSQAAQICRDSGVIPLIDVAYNGLGKGLDHDMKGVCALLDNVPRAFVAVSCSKNFGLYRERAGALYALAESQKEAEVLRSNLFAIARTSYSMPPDHGAAVVKTILRKPSLEKMWREELSGMTDRIYGIREQTARAFAGAELPYDRLEQDRGMFSCLPLSAEQIVRLRSEHAIYMAGNGRINIAGLREDAIDRFALALASVS